MRNKILFLLIGTIFLFSFSSTSQSLTFCEKADVGGRPINSNSVFTIAKNGGPVTLLFTLPAVANLNSVNIDLYRIDNGKEVFQSTMKQPMSASQNWMSKEITFYNEGKYRLYVFDEQDKQLAKADVMIKK